MNLRFAMIAYREKEHLTQAEMGKIVGLSKLDISRFEGGRDLSSKKMARIYKWLLVG